MFNLFNQYFLLHLRRVFNNLPHKCKLFYLDLICDLLAFIVIIMYHDTMKVMYTMKMSMHMVHIFKNMVKLKESMYMWNILTRNKYLVSKYLSHLTSID
jgi:hypothetical protein